MKNRYFVLILALLFGGVTLNSCEEIAQVQAPIDFAQIRIANFNNSCNAEEVGQVYDVYIYPVGTPSAIPEVRGGLSYGIVTPWIDNLVTNREAGLTYKVQVRAAGDIENKNIIDKEITLKPGDRYTLWIFKSDDPTAPRSEFISDRPTFDVESNKAYFRFMNTEDKPLTVKVGDPLIGNALDGKELVLFTQFTNYEGFNSATLDTTLTFFVVDADQNVVGRIAGVALENGTYKTITWGGNCPGRYVAQEEGVITRPDSHHVRILDDAGDGADETKIVPQTLRYFFVNALIPAAAGIGRDTAGYEQLGVVINNDNRYNFGPLSPYSASPFAGMTSDGVINVVPTATLLTDAVNVKGFVYNASAPNVRGQQLFDYRAGPRASMKTDELVAFVVSDTVRTNFKFKIDSAQGQFVFPIPDQPKPGQATLVIGNMLAPRNPPVQQKMSFFVNDDSVEFTGTWSRKFSKTIDVPAGQLNLRAHPNANPDEAVSTSFDAKQGGIYLILLVGRRLDTRDEARPRIMAIRTNP